MSLMREALERGDLLASAKFEASACDRDGYHDTAELIRQLAAALARLSQFESALPGSPGVVQKGERT